MKRPCRRTGFNCQHVSVGLRYSVTDKAVFVLCCCPHVELYKAEGQQALRIKASLPKYAFLTHL